MSQQPYGVYNQQGVYPANSNPAGYDNYNQQTYHGTQAGYTTDKYGTYGQPTGYTYVTKK